MTLKPPFPTQVSIALGMTLTLAAVPTIASGRAVFLRECGDFGGGGLSPGAAVAAKAVADVPRLCALAVVFVVAFYPLARPRAPAAKRASPSGATTTRSLALLARTWEGKGGFTVTSTCEFSDGMCQGKGPLFENSTGDDLSSKTMSGNGVRT